MTCNFDTEVELKFDFDYLRLYQCVCDTALIVENCPYEAEIELLIMDDESIQIINRDNRGIDNSTDVLSFPMNDYPGPGDFSQLEDDPEAFDPETGELILGDIVLSYDHIVKQAYEYGHSEEREYAFLIAHSMLHLMGYDHIEEEDRKIMEMKQKIIMERLYDDFPSLRVD